MEEASEDYRKRFYTNIHRITNPSCLSVLVDKCRQLGSDYIPNDLEMIDQRYNSGTLLLRHEARLAFEYMSSEAEKVGLSLTAVSTFRSFTYQKEVYYRYLSPDVPLDEYQTVRDRVSARAGHSEHQTGLAVDINETELTFETTQESQWLAENSYKYGFVLRYPKGKETTTGYDYEPWHFRYLGKELAEAVYLSGLTYDEYYAEYLC